MSEFELELQELRLSIANIVGDEVLTARQIMAAAWVLGVNQTPAFSTVLEGLMAGDDTGLSPGDLHAYTELLNATEASHAVCPAFSLLLMRKIGIVYSFYDDEGVVKSSADFIISPVDDGWALPYGVNGVDALTKEQGGDIREE